MGNVIFSRGDGGNNYHDYFIPLDTETLSGSPNCYVITNLKTSDTVYPYTATGGTGSSVTLVNVSTDVCITGTVSGYVKIYDKNNALVRYYIPVARKQDLEIGMYELLSHRFYINAGNTEIQYTVSKDWYDPCDYAVARLKGADSRLPMFTLTGMNYDYDDEVDIEYSIETDASGTVYNIPLFGTQEVDSNNQNHPLGVLAKNSKGTKEFAIQNFNSEGFAVESASNKIYIPNGVDQFLKLDNKVLYLDKNSNTRHIDCNYGEIQAIGYAGNQIDSYLIFSNGSFYISRALATGDIPTEWDPVEELSGLISSEEVVTDITATGLYYYAILTSTKILLYNYFSGDVESFNTAGGYRLACGNLYAVFISDPTSYSNTIYHVDFSESIVSIKTISQVSRQWHSVEYLEEYSEFIIASDSEIIVIDETTGSVISSVKVNNIPNSKGSLVSLGIANNMVLGATTCNFIYSIDGVTWNSGSYLWTNSLGSSIIYVKYNFAYINETYYALSDGFNTKEFDFESIDGIVWKSRHLPMEFGFGQLIANNDTCRAYISTEYQSSISICAETNDGILWEPKILTISTGTTIGRKIKKVCYSEFNNKYIAIGETQNSICISDDGKYWTVSSETFIGTFRQIRYFNNSVYILSTDSAGGYLKKTEDGIHWREYTISKPVKTSNDYWIDFAVTEEGPGKSHIILSHNGFVKTSPDLINWSAELNVNHASPSSGYRQCSNLHYCKEVLTAYIESNGGEYHYSLDYGATWSVINYIDDYKLKYKISTILETNEIMFCSVSLSYRYTRPTEESYYILYYSRNGGLTWHKSYNSTSTSFYGVEDVAYFNQKYLLIRSNTLIEYSCDYVSSLYSSNNLNNWMPNNVYYENTFSPGTFMASTYGNGIYVVLYNLKSDGASENHNVIAKYSYDYINWNQGTGFISSNRINRICYGNGLFVGVGNGPCVCYSTNGINWTDLGILFNYSECTIASILYAFGKFVILPSSINNAATNKYFYSDDGINWTIGTLTSTAYWGYLALVNDKLIAIASLDTSSNPCNISSYSSNGTSWTALNIPSTATWFSSTCDGNICYILGRISGSENDTNVMYYTVNGTSWSSITIPETIRNVGSITYCHIFNGVVMLNSGNSYFNYKYENGVWSLIGDSMRILSRSIDDDELENVINANGTEIGIPLSIGDSIFIKDNLSLYCGIYRGRCKIKLFTYGSQTIIVEYPYHLPYRKPSLKSESSIRYFKEDPDEGIVENEIIPKLKNSIEKPISILGFNSTITSSNTKSNGKGIVKLKKVNLRINNNNKSLIPVLYLGRNNSQKGVSLYETISGTFYPSTNGLFGSTAVPMEYENASGEWRHL